MISKNSKSPLVVTQHFHSISIFLLATQLYFCYYHSCRGKSMRSKPHFVAFQSCFRLIHSHVWNWRCQEGRSETIWQLNQTLSSANINVVVTEQGLLGGTGLSRLFKGDKQNFLVFPVNTELEFINIWVFYSVNLWKHSLLMHWNTNAQNSRQSEEKINYFCRLQASLVSFLVRVTQKMEGRSCVALARFRVVETWTWATG